MSRIFRRVSILFTTLALCLTALVATGSESAALVFGGGQIAYVKDGTGEIWLVGANGVGRRNLHVHGSAPTWSADGRRIGFGNVPPVETGPIVPSRFSTVFPIGLAQFDYLPNQNSAYQVAWSPDGTKLAYDRWTESDGNRIFISNLDGGEETMLVGTERTDRNNGPDHVPSWSPDGQYIVFESHTTGTSRISIMKADGTEAHEIPNIPPGVSSQPKFSPDGSQIVFVHLFPTSQAVNRLYVVGVDGSHPHALGPTNRYLSTPAFSPDGMRIAFASDGPNYAHDKASGIYVIRSNGRGLRRLTFTASNRPAWQPERPVTRSWLDQRLGRL